MVQTSHLKIDRDGPVARVTLNRPDLHNAFDDNMVKLLSHSAQVLSGDKKVRVIVLAGEGKSFCAGADLNWMQRMVKYTEAQNVQDSRELARMYEAWNEIPKPVVGRIHGAAFGGGVGLVSVCDVAAASADAQFAFSEVRLGILPAVISPFVAAKIGAAAARDLFLTGSRFSAARAQQIGLVHHVFPPDQLDERIGAILKALLAGGPEAQARIKSLLRETRGLPPEKVTAVTAETIARARVSPEGQEGMRAFLERRKPSWSGEA